MLNIEFFFEGRISLSSIERKTKHLDYSLETANFDICIRILLMRCAGGSIAKYIAYWSIIVYYLRQKERRLTLMDVTLHFLIRKFLMPRGIYSNFLANLLLSSSSKLPSAKQKLSCFWNRSENQSTAFFWRKNLSLQGSNSYKNRLNFEYCMISHQYQ